MNIFMNFHEKHLTYRFNSCCREYANSSDPALQADASRLSARLVDRPVAGLHHLSRLATAERALRGQRNARTSGLKASYSLQRIVM
jgi:hypothetical protein